MKRFWGPLHHYLSELETPHSALYIGISSLFQLPRIGGSGRIYLRTARSMSSSLTLASLKEANGEEPAKGAETDLCGTSEQASRKSP